VAELCCNVDDMTPESVGYAMETLKNAGALDVYWSAIGMKKCRPGVELSVLCREEDRDRMVRLIFRHTTTIGIRETLCSRFVLKRRSGTAEHAMGPGEGENLRGLRRDKAQAGIRRHGEIADKNGLSWTT
jgi:uncharacterized protein (DUF111 family)